MHATAQRQAGLAVCGFTAGVVLCLSLLAQGQVTAPGFRSGVDLVVVDAVVIDRDGRPVRNLTADDFEIREDGRVQRVAQLQIISIGPGGPNAIEPPAVDSAPMASTSALRYQGRRIAVVIDDLHLIEADIELIKRVLDEVARTVAPSDEVAAVFVGRSDLSRHFARGPSAAREASGRVRDALGFGLDAGSMKPFTLSYAISVTSTLQSVIDATADSSSSRRFILYVSGGSILSMNADPKSPERRAAESLEGALARVYERARRANVAIYTLDPRGLVLPETAVRGDINSEQVRRQVAERVVNQHQYLSEIALNTGGRSFFNLPDPRKGVAAILEENSHYYLISYQPDPPRFDGRFHQISVRVKAPGVTVRARRGYVAPSKSSGRKDPRR